MIVTEKKIEFLLGDKSSSVDSFPPDVSNRLALDRSIMKEELEVKINLYVGFYILYFFEKQIEACQTCTVNFQGFRNESIVKFEVECISLQ